jgi:hypothetical protein
MKRTFLIAIAAILITGSLVADDAAPARFLIERIEVRNTKRVSSKLVASETLLREGQEYSEEELRAASLRLSRLPFILSSDFALEKGSDRGRYVLAITVNEAKPFFYLLDIRPTLWDESRRAAHVDYDIDVDPTSESKDAGFGFRWFVGGRGVVHVGFVSHSDRQTFTRDYGAAAIGYTQYGLFGTAAFATINLRVPIDHYEDKKVSPQLVVGIPLSKNQTLSLDLENTNFNHDTLSLFGQELERNDSEQLMSLAWTYNTTNQPFVPTDGTLVRVSAVRSNQDRTSFTFAGPFDPTGGSASPPVRLATHLNGTGLDLVANHYWELSERNSVSAGVLAGWGTVSDRYHPPIFRPPVVDYRTTYEILHAGYSRNLWRNSSKSGDSRLEADLLYVTRQRDVERGAVVFGTLPENEHAVEGSISWARRSSWGMLRLGVGYAWQR